MVLRLERYIVLMVLCPTIYPQEMNTMCPIGGAMYYGPDYQMCFYVVIEAAISYNNKQAACSLYGGVLSHIPDKRANAFLFSALSEMSDSKFVLGLNDIDIEGVFVTYTGEVQQWINWADGQPNNVLGGENCCVFFASGNTMVVNDRLCAFEDYHTRALCHVDVSPDVPTYSFDFLNDGIGSVALFSKVQSPSKGIIGAQLKKVLVNSLSMCAILCNQDDSCHFFVYMATDTLCCTHAIPKISPTTGSGMQIGAENVWVRR
ncbi:uncharacterized protein LOC117330387 [Pecten maximus]|uniref:uncharacterized protein LOC117330387 n=1 Tax=Pecten maximus TaxID=6579 RepID=UPI001458BBBF|nr:uncharacterized protein LOC117330387 [Pecten maximus]